MLRFMGTMTLALLAAGPIGAQGTVMGDSGNPAYPVERMMEDGTRYFCRSEPELRDGKMVLPCIRPGSGGGLAGDGAGIGAGAAVLGLGLIALVANDGT